MHSKLYTSTAFLAGALLLAGQTQAADRPTQTRREVPLHVVGRITADGQHQWPGIYYEGTFQGGSATIALVDKDNAYNIYVDGKLVGQKRNTNVGIEPGKDGAHTIRVELANEMQAGPARLGSIHVTEIHGGGIEQVSLPLPAPVPRARQIEFIGDSYTVGYGNTSPKRQCTQAEIHDTTDTSQAFGPLTAKKYSADYQINAISGHGIVRNYGGSPGAPVPDAYPYVLFDKAQEYSDPSWKPQIIVIGLGTNDFSTPLNAGEKWKTRDALHADYEATYVTFVKSLRAQNPKAQFILMATDGAEGEIQSEVKKVIARLNADGESRIVFLPMNGLEMTGCDWHPSLADDRKVAGILTSYIDAHPELWQGK